MNAWLPYALADLIDVKHGFAFEGEYFRDEPPGDVLLTPGNFAIGGGYQGNKLKYYVGQVPGDFVLAPGDLLVSMTDLSKAGDTLGFPAIVPNDGKRYLHNQRLGKVLLKKGAPTTLAFIQWVLRTTPYRHEVLAGSTGSTVKHTSPSRILAYRFSLPPKAQQEAISNTLDALDDKVGLNRRMNATLEAMARAVFMDWFVDFGPTRAKLEGRAPYLVPDVWSLFPAKFDDDGIPAGWTIKRWGDLAVLEYGRRLESYQDPSGGYARVYGTNGPIGWHHAALSNEPGTIIGRKGAYRGVHFSDGPFFVIDTAFYLKERIPLSKRWAYYTILSLDINSMDSGSAIPSTSRDDFYALEVVLPPLEIQRRFDELFAANWERQKANLAESGSLSQMRDLLLPKLMSGEIRVKEAEKKVAELV